ncbi:hypothetical protein FQA39_LY11462 [Lamprigera yunnana]|nr:hypothetical protein FQA39_LY11462 [Lamprigera yunnana]
MKFQNPSRLIYAELEAIAATIGNSHSEDELPLKSDISENEIVHESEHDTNSDSLAVTLSRFDIIINLWFEPDLGCQYLMHTMMVRKLFITVFVSLGAICYAFDEASVSNRTGKFIGLWGIGIVRFENSVCPAANGLEGICYTRRQCTLIGGYASGKCAKVGVCCVVQVTCGATSSNNNTYFSNPLFPSTFTGASVCTLTVQRCNPDICQIRIDFLNFNLAQPNGDGTCVNDALLISGSGSNIGRICGENTGQHIYLDFNNANDIIVNVFTSAAVTFGRQWNLRIAQIGCDSPSRAPSGCLMYYSTTSGNVRSFNYGQAANSAIPPSNLLAVGTRQLVNMNYGICVRTASGFCGIQWSMSAGNEFAFSVSGDLTPLSLTGTDCLTDYIIIPDGSVSSTGQRADRFCGGTFPTVTTPSRPFVLIAVTDGNEALDSGNRGFSLSYTQQQCTNTFL